MWRRRIDPERTREDGEPKMTVLSEGYLVVPEYDRIGPQYRQPFPVLRALVGGYPRASVSSHSTIPAPRIASDAIPRAPMGNEDFLGSHGHLGPTRMDGAIGIDSMQLRLDLGVFGTDQCD